MMCKTFVSESIFQNRISDCSATTVQWITVVFENLFMKEFRVWALENRNGHSEKRANLHM